MAIIRIKRTTNNTLPTGLTFGELAFVQGSGATANRLYIANNAGVCVWIGAEILNSPAYWSGATAQTTIPTVSAVESRVVAGGGITFASNLNVNIDVGKFFGKYKKGDIIPAQGQTVKWVIEDALSETIIPGVRLQFSVSQSGGIPRGQTSGISYTVTPSYQIKTVGAVGAGATLEWKRSTDSGWTAYAGTFISGTETVGVTVNAVGSPFTGVTLNPGGTSDVRDFQYRFTVRDSAGATASVTESISIANYSSPTASWSQLNSPLLIAPETHTSREKGNTFSTIVGTITRNNTYIPLLSWKLQYNEGAGWLDTNRPSAGYQAASSPSSASVSTTHTASTTANRIQYRLLVVDGDRESTVTPNGSNITFSNRIFYGPTGTAPTTSDHIRSLPGTCMASANNSGLTYPNPFTLNTGVVYNNFVVALPQGPNGISLSSVVDLDASSQELISDYRQNISTIAVADRSGNNQNYTVYRFSPVGNYTGNPPIGNRHVCTTVGTFTSP